MPWPVRKHVEIGRVSLPMPEDEAEEFKAAPATISRTLEGVEQLPGASARGRGCPGNLFARAPQVAQRRSAETRTV